MEGVKLRVNCICISNPNATNKALFRSSVISYAKFVMLHFLNSVWRRKRKSCQMKKIITLVLVACFLSDEVGYFFFFFLV